MPHTLEAPMTTSPNRQPPKFGFVALMVAVLVGLGIGFALYQIRAARLIPQVALNPNAEVRVATPKTDPDVEEQQAINVFKVARDSVVNVDTVVLVRRFDWQIQEQQTGTGSGFVWDTEGRIVTNFHVVKEAVAKNLKVRVVMADRSAHDATVIGIAPNYDLAVVQIQVPKDKLTPIRVGTSSDLEVGQKVFAIGNPFAYSLTMTQGIVSALDRQIESPGDQPITGAIQHQAPINPGNSGGPLLDKDARLIGVNSSIATPSGGNVGIGFAIPVDTVNPIVTELIQHGRILSPDLGVTLLDQRVLRRAGFPKGVMIREVEPNGPAAKAGLRGLVVNRDTGDVTPGDLILAVDGVEVQSNADFARRIANHKVGDKVKLTIEWNDEKKEVEATLRGV